MKSNIKDVDAIFCTRTERGLCVRVDESSKEDIWLPLAQVEVEGQLARGGIVTITAPEQLLVEKGLV